MIHGRINNLSQYVTVNPNIKVLDFIKDNDLKLYHLVKPQSQRMFM